MTRIDHTIFDLLYEEITSDYSSYYSITGSCGSGGVKGGNLLLNQVYKVYIACSSF